MLPWIRTSRELVLKTHLFRLFREGFRSQASGKEGRFDVIETQDWVNVVAVTPEGEALMVRQFRYGSAELSLEFPAGCVEEGQSPFDTAVRELSEETGGRAGSWVSLGACRPNPAIMNNHCHHFWAKDVQVVQETSFDEHEELELVRVPMSDIDRLIAEGVVSHALSIVSWHLYKEKRGGA